MKNPLILFPLKLPLVFDSLSHHIEIHRPLSLPQPIYTSTRMYTETMTPTRKAWVVAAAIGAVEALKDCRWNYTVRSIQQNAKNNIRSFAQAKMPSSSSGSGSSSTTAANGSRNAKSRLNAREASLEKAMSLSCWGPTTTRF
ncbi:hypothetical protein P3X46_006767 [Hevea brasiliensis]|uniref:Uncharacterized protein n=1 Tax=Hevea brasiliensis TaxID=3981 RepID=A0ABQ9MRP1_HEVBR|nr:uncharacterized protein LOC110638500 [Hevea brasiliensis]KAJ9182816.1 hypothetical protein P3X46_006767 [Hevea brasiliensis]